ncbi:MAG: addiction module protein [Methylobacter tundripaludum]|nr:addiction module protein [Methylobacter tundripaludum]
MSIEELHKLSSVEKLKIIEALWGDLVGDEDNLSSPSWHETELIETEKQFLSGDNEVLDWQKAKKALRSRFE